jgi:hypothetical protein
MLGSFFKKKFFKASAGEQGRRISTSKRKNKKDG